MFVRTLMLRGSCASGGTTSRWFFGTMRAFGLSLKAAAVLSLVLVLSIVFFIKLLMFGFCNPRMDDVDSVAGHGYVRDKWQTRFVRETDDRIASLVFRMLFIEYLD